MEKYLNLKVKRIKFSLNQIHVSDDMAGMDQMGGSMNNMNMPGMMGMGMGYQGMMGGPMGGEPSMGMMGGMGNYVCIK